MVWSAIHGKAHKHLAKNEQSIEAFIPLVEALFPGINYYSMSGFHEVMQKCVTPALKKLFPALEKMNEGEVKADDLIKVEKFLPSNGYEWQDSPEWQSKFEKLLKTDAT